MGQASHIDSPKFVVFVLLKQFTATNKPGAKFELRSSVKGNCGPEITCFFARFQRSRVVSFRYKRTRKNVEYCVFRAEHIEDSEQKGVVSQGWCSHPGGARTSARTPGVLAPVL